MSRKIRTIHAAMLLSRNSTRTSESKQKRGYKAGDLAYVRDYRPNHRWTAAVVSKRHGSMVYEVGNEKWQRHHNQLKPRPSETSGAQTGIPLFTLLFKGSLSVIPNASCTFAATGEPQGKVIRISSLTKGDVRGNFIFLKNNRILKLLR